MRRRAIDAAVLGTVVMLLTATWVLPALAESLTVTFSDHFDTQSYSGNNGTKPFATDWIEFGEKDGAGSGLLRVYNHTFCDGDWCFKMGGSSVELTGIGVARGADLEGAVNARLSLDWGRELLGSTNGSVSIQVSPDGAYWRTLKTVALDDDDDGKLKHHESWNIIEWATGTTQIRIISLDGSDVESYFVVDNVEIQTTYEGGQTTTTTTTTEPPTTSTTTTTTKPPVVTTTTTTKPPEVTTTTTTKPPTTTTTTKPPTTTTTRPPPATTTTVPPTTTTVPPTTTTTTTTAPAAAPPPPSPPPPDRTDLPEAGTQESFESKTGLVARDSMPSIAVPGAGTTRDAAAEASHPTGLTPVQGMMATFTTSAESLQSNLLASLALGLLVAWLAVRGIGGRAWRRERAAGS